MGGVGGLTCWISKKRGIREAKGLRKWRSKGQGHIRNTGAVEGNDRGRADIVFWFGEGEKRSFQRYTIPRGSSQLGAKVRSEPEVADGVCLSTDSREDGFWLAETVGKKGFRDKAGRWIHSKRSKGVGEEAQGGRKESSGLVLDRVRVATNESKRVSRRGNKGVG